MSRMHIELKLTTQGPPYPPSEIMDPDGNFVVIGNVIQPDGSFRWSSAIVAADSPLPEFGKFLPYRLIRALSSDELLTSSMVLHTLCLPLPCCNYPIVFAPEQLPHAHQIVRPSRPLHDAFIPDIREQDGRKVTEPITLGQWCRAKGILSLELGKDWGDFQFEFEGMIPNSLYTIMALRRHDIRAPRPTRPGPLGVPNVFIADARGRAHYWARMPNPFPADDVGNRIIDVIVLFISSQMSFGGAIGHHGLGGDIHAQLKSTPAPFAGLLTRA
jgi:hypothetical protein